VYVEPSQAIQHSAPGLTFPEGVENERAKEVATTIPLSGSLNIVSQGSPFLFAKSIKYAVD
jgi:hypothetical protein